jgi:hypothetical protein
MRIITHGTGPYVDLSISGTTITIATIEIDLAARQSDWQQVIDIRATGTTYAEADGTHLVASIELPPIERDAQGQPQPLQRDRVTLTLWPYASATSNPQETI